MPLIDRFFHGGGVNVPTIFGNGSDGDLHIAAGETVTLPVEHPHKDIIIREYKSIHIETGGTLITSAPNCGLVLRCKGDCVIDGVIDQSGKGGYTNYDINFEYPAIMCGAGGNGGAGGAGFGSGGDGGSGNKTPSAPGRPYGGGAGTAGSGGGGGGGWEKVSGGYNPWGGIGGTDAQAASNDAVVTGGVGGEGRNITYSGQPGKDGKASLEGLQGGGLVVLYAGGRLDLRGNIDCSGKNGVSGGDGGAGGYYYTLSDRIYHGGGGGGGGGTGGGAVYICHNGELFQSGTINVNGGAGGSGGAGQTRNECRSYNGSAGSTGSIGEIKIIKYKRGMTV